MKLLWKFALRVDVFLAFIFILWFGYCQSSSSAPLSLSSLLDLFEKTKFIGFAVHNPVIVVWYVCVYRDFYALAIPKTDHHILVLFFFPPPCLWLLKFSSHACLILWDVWVNRTFCYFFIFFFQCFLLLIFYNVVGFLILIFHLFFSFLYIFYWAFFSVW